MHGSRYTVAMADDATRGDAGGAGAGGSSPVPRPCSSPSNWCHGWPHPNPPVVEDAPWPDAESAAIARASCYSCHSNETDWPAYSYVAPFSWLVRRDVDAGRRAQLLALGP